MSISLEFDIRQALARQADRTTIEPDPRFGGLVIRADEPARRPGTGRTMLAVAATVVVAIGGLVVLDRLRADDTAPAADLPAPGPQSGAVGLYPAGDLAAVVSAGYATPQAAAEAYLADRTRVEVLPDGYTVTASISDVEPVRVRDDEAIVAFSLQTTNDGGDGLLLVRQVAPSSAPERWAVTAGGIATVAIDQLDYRDGRLTGSISTGEAGGRNVIDVYDAVTGERLAGTTDSAFTIDGLSAPALAVRLWRTEGDGGFPRANFAEAIVRDGETVTSIGEAALHDEYFRAVQQRTEQPVEPFDTGPISAFLPGSGGVVTIVDDPDLTIEAQVQVVERTGQQEYCLAVSWAGREFGFASEAACFSPEVVSAQQLVGNGAGMGEAVAVVDAMDGKQVLVIGAVPDAVTEIRTESGKSIAPVANVWWDVIDAGTLMTYTVVTGDGRTTVLTAG